MIPLCTIMYKLQHYNASAVFCSGGVLSCTSHEGAGEICTLLLVALHDSVVGGLVRRSINVQMKRERERRAFSRF